MRESPKRCVADLSGTKLVGAKRVFLITDKDDPPGSSNPAPAKTVFGVGLLCRHVSNLPGSQRVRYLS